MVINDKTLVQLSQKELQLASRVCHDIQPFIDKKVVEAVEARISESDALLRRLQERVDAIVVERDALRLSGLIKDGLLIACAIVMTMLIMS